MSRQQQNRSSNQPPSSSALPPISKSKKSSRPPEPSSSALPPPAAASKPLKRSESTPTTTSTTNTVTTTTTTDTVTPLPVVVIPQQEPKPILRTSTPPITRVPIDFAPIDLKYEDFPIYNHIQYLERYMRVTIEVYVSLAIKKHASAYCIIVIAEALKYYVPDNLDEEFNVGWWASVRNMLAHTHEMVCWEFIYTDLVTNGKLADLKNLVEEYANVF